MIANCAVLGLDWRAADLSDYLEGLEAYNEAHDPDAKKKGEPRGPSDPDRLRRFRKARQALN